MELLSMVVILHALCLAQGGLYTPSLSQTCSGTLGTLKNGSWEAVTLNHLHLKENKDLAEQVCRLQGCGSLYDYNDTMSVNTSLISCFGNSLKLNCTEASPAISSQRTEIVCEHQAIRLAAGPDGCAGRVELFSGGQWGTVCDDEWNLRAGDVVCAQLSCGTALRVTGEAGDFLPGKGPIHISKLNCTGAERNLWECGTREHTDSNYCGHKEDAGVVCSGSAMVAVTISNITEPHLTNWTTAFVPELVVEDSSSTLSAPVWGCIVLSGALLLVLLSNAALCKHYKGRHARVIHQLDHDSQTREDGDVNNLQVVTAHTVTAQTPLFGGPEARRPSLQDDSETSSDSNYYFDPQMPAHANDLHFLNDAPVVAESNQAQGTICRDEKPLKNTISCDALDSESTSSGECYENTEAEREQLFNPDVNQFYGEQSLPMGNFSNTSPSAKINRDALDSESTSSGECYENTEAEQEQLFNPDVNQFYREQSLPMGHHLSNTSPSAKINHDASDSDSTSSGDCYENIGLEAEAFVQKLDGSQSHPEQTPLSHHIPQPTGFLHEPSALNQDDSSTSSGEDYENVPELDDENCQSSSSSDYDDVTNW